MPADALEISSPKSGIPANQSGLSSTFFQWLFFFYIFFYVTTAVAPVLVVFTYYIQQWHLSYVFYINTLSITFLSATVSEFIVSKYADKSESKYGRRKPYVVVGFFFVSIGTNYTM